MRKNKQGARTERAARRELEKVIKPKLNGYINAFYSICYFEEEKLDWNAITEGEYQRLRGKWKAWCKSRKYSGDIAAAFQHDCMLLKTDLILQVKYQATCPEADKLMFYLKKGMTPLELADYAKKNLTLKTIENEAN